MPFRIFDRSRRQKREDDKHKKNRIVQFGRQERGQLNDWERQSNQPVVASQAKSGNPVENTSSSGTAHIRGEPPGGSWVPLNASLEQLERLHPYDRTTDRETDERRDKERKEGPSEERGTGTGPKDYVEHKIEIPLPHVRQSISQPVQSPPTQRPSPDIPSSAIAIATAADDLHAADNTDSIALESNSVKEGRSPRQVVSNPLQSAPAQLVTQQMPRLQTAKNPTTAVALSHDSDQRLRTLELLVRFLPDGKTQHVRNGNEEEVWRRTHSLGQGAYGTVWQEECVSGSPHATKAVRAVKQTSRSQHLAWQRELEALNRFAKHRDHFVQCLGWFQDDSHLYIAMEFIPHGTLQQHINRRRLPEPEAILVTKQLAQALQYMHSVGFIHRDLKCLNILVNRPGPKWHVKIADFGISKEAAAGSSTVAWQGTVTHLAPEILSEVTGRYSPAADIWSLGVVVFCLLTKRLPFESPRETWRYADGITTLPTQWLGRVSHNGVQFLHAAMAPTRENRLTTEQVISHPWLADLEDSDEEDETIKRLGEYVHVL